MNAGRDSQSQFATNNEAYTPSRPRRPNIVEKQQLFCNCASTMVTPTILNRRVEMLFVPGFGLNKPFEPALCIRFTPATSGQLAKPQAQRMKHVNGFSRKPKFAKMCRQRRQSVNQTNEGRDARNPIIANNRTSTATRRPGPKTFETIKGFLQLVVTHIDTRGSHPACRNAHRPRRWSEPAG